MKEIVAIAGIAVLAATLTAAERADADWISLKVAEPKTITVQPGTKKGSLGNHYQVSVGSSVMIACAWEQVSFVQIKTEWDAAKKLSALNWEYPGEITLDGVKIKAFTVPAKNIPPTQGMQSAQWLAGKAGVYNGACSVDPEKMTNTWGNHTIYFDIAVVESTPPAGYRATQPKAPPTKFSPYTGPVAPTQPKGLPDITSGNGVTIGGKSAAWGSNVTVDAKDAHSVNMNNSGLCEFGIKHTARNVGLASTGGFDSLWKNSAVPGSVGRFWLPIAPGASKEETDLVQLKPGQNLLHLTLDNLSKVQESNENNNKFRLIVNLTGSCGPKPGLVPPPKGGAQSGQPASPRLPAGQKGGILRVSK